jgi:prepilin-type N-terminal cleavage/methylation domain-containing protein
MERQEDGFTLIEMMIVVAVLGVLVAIAAPAYVRYIMASRATVVVANFDRGTGLIQTEISKRSAGSTSYLDTDIEFVQALNRGGKKSPYDSALDAFVTQGNSGPGTVEIWKDVANQTYEVIPYDGSGNPVAGHTITIIVE